LSDEKEVDKKRRAIPYVNRGQEVALNMTLLFKLKKIRQVVKLSDEKKVGIKRRSFVLTFNLTWRQGTDNCNLVVYLTMMEVSW
jgi:hypothetical protein